MEPEVKGFFLGPAARGGAMPAPGGRTGAAAEPRKAKAKAKTGRKALKEVQGKKWLIGAIVGPCVLLAPNGFPASFCLFLSTMRQDTLGEFDPEFAWIAPSLSHSVASDCSRRFTETPRKIVWC